MPTCETCGNDYEKSFEVVIAHRRHTFDSFECAIQMLAPVCDHCGCKIIGHGVETATGMFCCGHCASHQASPARDGAPSRRRDKTLAQTGHEKERDEHRHELAAHSHEINEHDPREQAINA
jgi:hypothetical protein